MEADADPKMESSGVKYLTIKTFFTAFGTPYQVFFLLQYEPGSVQCYVY